MPNFTSADHLKRQQYHNVDKLAARIRLHELFSTNAVDIHHWVFDRMLLEIPEQARILELGCGRGDIWAKNAGRVPAGWEILLTDFSDGMLDACKSFLHEHFASNRFDFDTVDIQNIPYEDQSFDAVMANMMLYHVADRPKAIREVRRVLKPDGVFLAMTNGDKHMRDLYLLGADFDDENAAKIKEYDGIFSKTFSLQNGGDQLRASFHDVVVHSFDNDLLVTELQPLLDYIASMIDRPEINMLKTRSVQLSTSLAERIEKEGGIRIQKETGIFVARGFPA